MKRSPVNKTLTGLSRIYDSGCDSYFHTDAEQCPKWSA